ncbi:MAG: hypothetical protein Q7N95_01160 [Alphaproteobacteria bacterium]|nr:hypothetical protein [Alphaproteobacteria bacterium]
MQSIGQYFRANPLGGLAVLAGVMLATRFHHFGSVTHLPDASLAVFFLAGFYLRRAIYMIPLMLLAGGIDYLATQHMGVSDYCISPAYGFLIPTYAVMWFGGHWYAARHTLSVASLTPLAVALIASGSIAFLISNGGFYLFSGRYPDMSWAEYAQRVSMYYMPYMSGAVFYVVLAALAHIGVTVRPRSAQGDAPR